MAGIEGLQLQRLIGTDWKLARDLQMNRMTDAMVWTGRV